MVRKYSAYILCLLISILVVALYNSNFSPLNRLEWKIQDLLYSFRGQSNNISDIVLVNIDDRTLNEFGSWPWHRDRVADLVAAVGSGQPKTIFLDMFFDPNVAEDTLGYTGILAGQMSWTKNVILPYEINRGEIRTNRISTPKYLYPFSAQVNNDLGVLDENSSLLAQKVFLPPEELCQYSAGMGFKYVIQDLDRKIRWEPLIMYYDGYYYPSAQLMAAANYLGKPASSIVVSGGDFVRIGIRQIPINDRGELFINYSNPGNSFVQISAADILNEKVDFGKVKDKLAIISVTAERVADLYHTPVSPNLPASEVTANVIENIVHANFMKRMDSSPGTDMLILFVLGGAFAFILPRVSLLYRMVILIISLFVLANLNFILFNSLKILIRSLYIGLEIFLLILAGPILDNEFLSRFSSIPGKQPIKSKVPKLPKIETPHRDFGTVRPPAAMPGHSTETAQSNIATGMMDTPRHPKAAAQPDTTAAATVKAEKTVSMVADNVKEAPIDETEFEYNSKKYEASEMPAEESPITSTPSFGIDSPQLKNLGRYRVVGELGKGAMGTVYKGVDPAINRNVALKTIRLDFVQDPEEFAELKERLFREARAAGKLSHSNIVTIYDVGTEGTLQYIAMEYLQGQTLEEMIRKKVKFNYRIIAQIITQICSALEYAHSQGIVHRDIKPANIMVLNDYTIKVMDFGIARVDSSSMTRTGIAMGTPNYISPEQLQGRPVDHRTDIFSLGIVMYEMLVQRRPFRGENLTSLIYNIVNTEPELPSSIDKSIPLLFDRVIDKALKKNPDERYQKAGDVATALYDFIQTFSGKRSMPV
ncbi:MAG: serine/threonine-protein kinase [candidate division Zixibacteria bacterium]|nr:serine/threonine-protein kinase [candidate division Zixibacteria bacterium]